jgi:16S rRNA (uracil1498-N3)-methyltransferase
MSSDVYLVEASQLADVRVGELLELGGDEGRHAVTVKRVTPGEAIELVDGSGRRAMCSVVEVSSRDTLTVIVSALRNEPAPQPRIIVVQAIPKGDRGELAVETLTEVGVDAIVPWSARRCVAKWSGEKTDRGVAKWRRTAREATKQARRSWIPDVADVAATTEITRLIASGVRDGARAIVLHEAAVLRLASMKLPTHAEVILVVGPEGGIAPEELAAFEAAGALSCRMGPSVLRTSTAGTAAAAVVLASTGRWS